MMNNLPEDIMKFFEVLFSGEALRGEVVGTTQFTHGDIDWDIDTCETADCGWETAVCIYYKNQPAVDWVIVERYPDRDAAILGHNKWVLDIERNHTTAFFSVQDHTIHMLEVVE